MEPVNRPKTQAVLLFLHSRKCWAARLQGRLLSTAMHQKTIIIYLLFSFFVFALLSITVSNFILPRKGSPCGRLVHCGVSDSALTLNEVRLNSHGQPWSEIEFRYRLLANEVVNFIVNRKEDTFTVLRLSSTNTLDSAILLFRSGKIIEKFLMSSPPTRNGYGAIRS